MKTQSSQTPTRFDDLRQLLLGDEQRKLESLQNRLSESETALSELQRQFTHKEQDLIQEIEDEKAKIKSLQAALQDRETSAVARLARDLAPALQQRERQGPEAFDELASAMQPSTISAIQKSARRDKQPLTEALFPIMGPAIRSYVLDLFRGMAEDLNQSIQNATSIERLKWRVQAKMAGKPYSEYVLLKTRSYSIEEVYLMQRDTGLLLLHAAQNPANEANSEADLVSGMFTAIRSFVKDSFSSSETTGNDNEEELGRFTFGDREVLIEVGPSLILAAVARGVPSPDARDELKNILEQLHGDLQPVLENFSGDTVEVEKSRPLLRQALIEQKPQKEERKRGGLWRAWVTLAFLALAVTALLFLAFREQKRWNRFESDLRTQAGISVADVNKSGLLPRREVRGVRDPLATDPAELARKHEINLTRTDFQFSLIQSLDEPFRSKREKEWQSSLLEKQNALLSQIKQLEITLEKSEQTQNTQISQATQSLIESLFGDIPDLTIDFDEEAVRLRGKLSSTDLALVQSRVTPLQSLRAFDTSGLFDDSTSRLENLRNRIEKTNLIFYEGTLQLERESELPKLINLLLEFKEVAAEVKVTCHYQVFAHPLIGTRREANREIEKERIVLFRRALTDKGLAPDLLPPKLSEDMTKAGDGLSVQIVTKINLPAP